MALRPLDLLVRVEWAAVLAAAVAAYAWSGASWWLFAALILAPDLSMLGYLAGPRAGALAYNLLHTLLGPALLAVLGAAAGTAAAWPLAAIWLAHIGLDRMLGYGLKHASGFADTHMGRIGRAPARISP